ncbi:MAG: hypothetical protein ACRDU4_18770, partial [Mycobacterium sp.]
MAERVRLRRIGDPVLAAGPSGMRIRTRIQVSDAEAAAFVMIGTFLGSVYRGELAARIGCGVLNTKGRAVWRADRKQAITAVTSSRWAGAITRAVEDQYQLGLRGVAAHVADLRAAIEVLEQRCAQRPGERAAGNGRDRPRRGYRSAAERFAKARRLVMLRERLAARETALLAGHPSITVGGKRLWRTRNHLDSAAISAEEWQGRWNAARMFFTADGESGKAGGNETILVDTNGQLRIKVPAALVDELGTHLVIAASVRFAHRADEWTERVTARRAVRYDISYDADRGRWYLDASWKTTPQPAPTVDSLAERANPRR